MGVTIGWGDKRFTRCSACLKNFEDVRLVVLAAYGGNDIASNTTLGALTASRGIRVSNTA